MHSHEALWAGRLVTQRQPRHCTRARSLAPGSRGPVRVRWRAPVAWRDYGGELDELRPSSHGTRASDSTRSAVDQLAFPAREGPEPL